MVKQSRIDAVDIVRGIAISGVVLFHIVWDLEFTGIISGMAFHPIWLGFGRILAGTFMFLVGYSLVLAHPKGVVKRGPFLRRLSIISAAALIITLITWFAFPNSFIFFGILHSIVIASFVGIVFLKTPAIVPLVAGILVLALPQYLQIDAFNSRWLAWIGLYSSPPISNDFVPVFPWFGLTLLGIFLAKIVKHLDLKARSRRSTNPGNLRNSLIWAGRRTLPIYLLHQPVLLLIIIPVSWILQTF
ncbi:MAG: heparan-alpha-glucosaminide N-acetyltransferase [Salaquimonas sp.]